jgi:hypothetical protein
MSEVLPWTEPSGLLGFGTSHKVPRMTGSVSMAAQRALSGRGGNVKGYTTVVCVAPVHYALPFEATPTQK